jgi:hypothetical protein
MKITFNIYIPDTQQQAPIDLEVFIQRWGGITLGSGYALKYLNLFGYANKNLLSTLTKKCKQSGWYFNEYPPEIQSEINSEYDDYS